MRKVTLYETLANCRILALDRVVFAVAEKPASRLTIFSHARVVQRRAQSVRSGCVRRPSKGHHTKPVYQTLGESKPESRPY